MNSFYLFAMKEKTNEILTFLAETSNLSLLPRISFFYDLFKPYVAIAITSLYFNIFFPLNFSFYNDYRHFDKKNLDFISNEVCYEVFIAIEKSPK